MNSSEFETRGFGGGTDAMRPYKMVSSSIKRFRSVSSRNFVLDHTSPNHNHSSSNNSNSSINCNNDRHHDEDNDSNNDNDNDNHENHDNHDNHNHQLDFSYVRAAL